jgi:lysophospholipase
MESQRGLMDRLIALAKNPVPSGAIVGSFKGFDGAPLRFARWEPTRGPRRGTVCLFGGRTEHIEKYFEVIADLRRRGFGVVTMDWRGQGGSHRPLPNPRKGHIYDFGEHDRDLMRFVKDIVLPDCLPPFIALGHSMGAHILMRNAISNGSWFDRLVALAPMLAFHPERVRYPAWFARCVTSTAARGGMSTLYIPGGSDVPQEFSLPFEGNPLTSNLERWSRNRAVLEAAPELALGSPTYGWTHAAYRSMDALMQPETPGRVQVPMLIFSAGHDTVISNRAIEEFANQLKVGTHILLPAARHEILQESDDVRGRFWAAFDAYLGVEMGAL